MPRLLRVLAEHSSQLVNYSGFGAQLGMNHVTTQKYLGVLESLFLVHTLPPWYTNRLKRLTKSPKLHFLDSGLLAALRRITPDHLRRDRAQLGPLLETFVLSELRKLATWADDRYAFSHFRDKEGKEVDIVIENGRGDNVGVEVKASATVSKRDFSGLQHLAVGAGERFVMGIVLYDHDVSVSYGQQLAAVPISALWSESRRMRPQCSVHRRVQRAMRGFRTGATAAPGSPPCEDPSPSPRNQSIVECDPADPFSPWRSLVGNAVSHGMNTKGSAFRTASFSHPHQHDRKRIPRRAAGLP